jgi:hypothetical protein
MASSHFIDQLIIKPTIIVLTLGLGTAATCWAGVRPLEVLQSVMARGQPINKADVYAHFLLGVQSNAGLKKDVLLKGLEHPDALLRGFAAFHLGETKDPDAHVVKALFTGVQDSNPMVASQAIGAIRRIGQTHGQLLLDYLVRWQPLQRFYAEQRALGISASDLAVFALAGSTKVPTSKLIETLRHGMNNLPPPPNRSLLATVITPLMITARVRIVNTPPDSRNT